MKQGFTLIELIIVVALIFIFSSTTFPVSYSFFHKTAIKDEARNIESSLRKAQALAITSRNDSSAGVKFSQDGYTVFEGESYEDRRESKDLVIAFPIVMSVDGVQEVVFEKTTGLPIFPGMIGHWDFNEIEGDIVYDSSYLFQNNGTIFGTWARVGGKDGNCLELNGNAYVNSGNSYNLNLDNKISISAWVNVSSAGSGLIVKKGNPAQGTGYNLSLSGGYIVFALGDGSSSQSISSSYGQELFGQWVYLTAVWDGEIMKQYINKEVQSGTRSFNGSIGSSEDDLIIGEGLTGKIDDVRLYNYALSDKDLETNYLTKTDDIAVGLKSGQEKAHIIINCQGKIEAIEQ
ncbi:MAG: hypothetical protein A2Z68_00880 [Candidatus Nealsonbacteria bacterium RBG_13_38_11]|uniref:LamG-like jellyroll fold domain-containing protein n=1 Tax=Candidatus Nealsonbacteria bacterium RBG_13_38_11 TaxID=1801662 RepID=A0A1G2DYB0_9BACT|nr:MAG: hypothetical protein A2Z68_00880 [Candidatus Nealsonbacteria bacterium RBG_13_38_11]